MVASLLVIEYIIFFGRVSSEIFRLNGRKRGYIEWKGHQRY